MINNIIENEDYKILVENQIKETEKNELEKAIGKAKAKLVFDYYHK